MLSYTDFNHDEYAKTCRRNDFWGQIRRTVRGKPVDEEQIELIVGAINNAIDLNSTDNVLDLCCGNGALSSRISKYTSGLIGVDNSEFLISVAKEYFEKVPSLVFSHSEIIEFLNEQDQMIASKINKILCYGSISYLDSTTISQIFDIINIKFKSVTHFFIGNIPDIARAKFYFTQRNLNDFDLDSHTTSIGKWWERDEIIKLADAYSWGCHILEMPKIFYGSNYRFDALLTHKFNSSR